MIFHVQRAVKVITRVNVPISIAARHHDEELTLRRTPNPQGQPEIEALTDGYRVPVFTGHWSELHQPDLGAGRTARPRLVEKVPPCRQLFRRSRRVNALIPKPTVERLEIVLADELLHYIPPLLT
jgi:hypothetical protein